MESFFFDTRGAILPFSLLEISYCYWKMPPGGIIKILTFDKNLTPTLKTIFQNYQFDLSLKEIFINDEQCFQISIRKKMDKPLSGI